MKKIYLGVIFFWAVMPVSSLLAKNIVTGIQGQPVLVRDGQETVLTDGTEIAQGDTVKTGEGGLLDISLNGRSGVRILAETEVEMRQLDEKNTDLDMKVGNIIANLKKKVPSDGKFEVSTPAAVLAVRGTQFWGQAVPGGEGKPQSTFAVREGILSVRDKITSEEWMVNKGGAIEISGVGKPALTRAASAGELSAISQAEEIKIEE